MASGSAEQAHNRASLFFILSPGNFSLAPRLALLERHNNADDENLTRNKS
jgi:hypothetical protein